MSWTNARPQDTWGQGEMYGFLREIYTRLKFASFTWNPPSVGAATSVDTTLTVSDTDEVRGLRAGQSVSVTPPSSLDTGLSVGGAWVATDDSLTIRLANVTASPINPSSDTWAFHGMVL